MLKLALTPDINLLYPRSHEPEIHSGQFPLYLEIVNLLSTYFKVN